MRSAGFTLIELLVVISIMSIAGVVAFANFKGVSQDYAVTKAKIEIQSSLRVAQSNATSSVKCPDSGVSELNQGAKNWYIVFKDPLSMELRCDTGTTTNYLYRTYRLDKAQINQIQGNGCSVLAFPVTFNFSSQVGQIGKLSVSPSDSCLNNASSIVFTISNQIHTVTKTFNISKGGAINVQ